MIADELSQDDIDSLLGGLTGDDGAADDGAADLGGDDPLAALTSDEVPSLDDEAPAEDDSAGGGAPVDLPELQPEEPSDEATAQKVEDLLSDVNLKVKVRLGKTTMLVEDILKLKPGRVVQLDRLSGDPVDVLVNDRVVAKGEVIILNEAFCVRVTEIFTVQDKLERQD